MDQQYIKYPVLGIHAEEPLPGDIYLFVNNHYLKYKDKGDSIALEKFQQFINKRLNFIYIKQIDEKTFIDWDKEIQNGLNNQLQLQVGQEHKDIVEDYFSVRSEYMSFITSDITDESIKNVIQKTKGIISKVKKNKSIEKSMAKLLLYGKSASDHAMNVANLSTFLAINTGYEQQVILENIYTGALLHDFGKTRIDPKYLEESHSSEYRTAMSKHPSLGKTALIVENGFNDETLRIIIEHHENIDGSGYPKGLKNDQIYELTKIVSIANEFDHLVHMQTKNDSLNVKHKRAINSLEKQIVSGNIFDSKLLAKSVRALKMIVHQEKQHE